MGLARRFLTTWLINIAAIFVAAHFIHGVDYAHDLWILVLAALVFGLVNALVKPVVKVLAFPLVILSLGIALFFVNVLMLYVTTWLVNDFRIRTLRDGIAATLIIWVVNVVLSIAFDRKGKRRKRRR